jgi:hypothetical protein
MKKDDQKKPIEEEAEAWDFSEGFGGIPQDVELTRNIGCASDSKKGKLQKNLPQKGKSENG